MFDRIWLKYKQHRFETVAVAVLCLIATAGSLFEAWRLYSVGVPASCLVDGRVPYWYGGSGPMDACQLASLRFTGIVDGWDIRMVEQIGQLLPFVAGIVIGAPLVAGEIEQGTAPLSWALAGSRWKWLAGKLAAALVLIVPLLLAAGLAADVLQGAATPGIDSHASMYNLTSRGVFFPLWGVATLLGTVALGALKARTLPVVLMALVVCLLARATWDPLMNAYVLHGMAVLEMPGVNSSGELLVYQSSVLYLDGKVYTGTACVLTGGMTMCQYDQSTEPEPMTGGPQQGWYVVTGDHYWPVVALESAIMLAGSVVFGAFAFFWVGRRRPY